MKFPIFVIGSLCSLVSAEPGGAAPIVVMCTMRNARADLEEALAAGADEYIMKPFDGEILAAKLEEAGA